jgi:protein TonB
MYLNALHPRLTTLLCVVLCLLLTSGVLLAQDAVVRIPSAEASKAAIKTVTPTYPSMAKQMNVAGSVELDAIIDETGKVASVKVLKGNPLLTGAAEAALKKWTFKPFTREGKTVKAAAMFAFSFTP